MIILLGLPKCGTCSFQSLFISLGYKSYHWVKDWAPDYIGMMIYKNKQNNLPLLNDFCDTDVITQMDICLSKELSYWPQIIDYKQLYEENPDSIFILNKKDPRKLLDSFKRWENYDQRLYNYSPEIINNKTDEGFIEFVQNLYDDMENFFAKHPTSKFITYDIEKDNVSKLNKYIDTKDITELPHKNKNPVLSQNQ